MRRRSRCASVAAATLSVVVTASGCQSLRTGNPDGPDYAALGDSYTAAPGIGLPDGADGCRRARDNYPHQVADELGLNLTDVSCSGAQTSAVEGRQDLADDDPDPQVEAVGENTDVVTIGLGANDFNLVGAVIITCVQLARETPDGSPCQSINDGLPAEEQLDAKLTQVEDNLVGVVEAVRDRAPEAQVVLVGYPQIFPDPADGGCDLLPLAAGDLGYARDVNVGLNTAMAAAAERTGAEYVDLFTPTEGHDICGDDPWIAGSQVEPGRRAVPYHPYVEEQELVVALLSDVID